MCCAHGFGRQGLLLQSCSPKFHGLAASALHELKARLVATDRDPKERSLEAINTLPNQPQFA